MKTLIIFGAVFAFGTVDIHAQEYAVGIAIAASTGEIAASTCTKSGPECDADCSTLMICAAGNPTPLQTVLCSSPNQYCVGGACTTKPASTCTSGTSFLCTDDGVFPEPSDCTRYRVCTSGVSELFQCPSGFVFDSTTNLCKKGSKPCSKIDCSKATTANPYILYASNPAYYAYCLNYGNGTIQTIMFKCPFEQFEVFDMKIKECKFNCKAKGNYQNPANCNEYYYCSGASATPTLIPCATNYVFDGSSCNPNSDKCQYPPS